MVDSVVRNKSILRLSVVRNKSPKWSQSRFFARAAACARPRSASTACLRLRIDELLSPCDVPVFADVSDAKGKGQRSRGRVRVKRVDPSPPRWASCRR